MTTEEISKSLKKIEKDIAALDKKYKQIIPNGQQRAHFIISIFGAWWGAFWLSIFSGDIKLVGLTIIVFIILFLIYKIPNGVER